MLQLIGIPLIVAAWAIPILFVLTLGFLFSLAVFRPLFLAWSHAWDAAGVRLNREVQEDGRTDAVPHVRTRGPARTPGLSAPIEACVSLPAGSARAGGEADCSNLFSA